MSTPAGTAAILAPGEIRGLPHVALYRGETLPTKCLLEPLFQCCHGTTLLNLFVLGSDMFMNILYDYILFTLFSQIQFHFVDS